jgi:hypothetical protein
VAVKFPQSAYTGLQKSLQQEWQYLQRVCKDIGDEFSDLWKAISETFLSALYGDELEVDQTLDPRISLAILPVKFSGLALPDPTVSAKENYDSSVLASSHLTAAMRGVDEFRTADHTATHRSTTSEVRTRKRAKNDSDLTSIISKLNCDLRRTILRGKETGQFLSVMPSTINGTELSAVEFRDALLLRIGRSPGDLRSHCDGCGQKFSIGHGLECRNGGLMIQRHDEIRDELADLASKAFIPSAVRDEPRIYPGRPAATMPDLDPADPSVTRYPRKEGDERGDVLIRGLWARGTDCIIDVRVTNLDAKSNISRDPDKVLEAHEKEKRKKYLKPCLDQRRHFSPFVVSTDGLLGKEAKTLLKKLSSVLSVKWGKPYSEVCGYVNARMSIAIVRATHLCLRGSRVPASRMSNRRPQWEDKAGLSLFRH